MELSKENIAEILSIMSKHFVKVESCNEIQSEHAKKFANDDTRIQLFEQKMASWEWIFKLIATGTVGTLVTSVLALILK